MERKGAVLTELFLFTSSHPIVHQIFISLITSVHQSSRLSSSTVFKSTYMYFDHIMNEIGEIGRRPSGLLVSFNLSFLSHKNRRADRIFLSRLSSSHTITYIPHFSLPIGMWSNILTRPPLSDTTLHRIHPNSRSRGFTHQARYTSSTWSIRDRLGGWRTDSYDQRD